jgi:hypothetical protein
LHVRNPVHRSLILILLPDVFTDVLSYIILHTSFLKDFPLPFIQLSVLKLVPCSDWLDGFWKDCLLNFAATGREQVFYYKNIFWKENTDAE